MFSNILTAFYQFSGFSAALELGWNKEKVGGIAGAGAGAAGCDRPAAKGFGGLEVGFSPSTAVATRGNMGGAADGCGGIDGGAFVSAAAVMFPGGGGGGLTGGALAERALGSACFDKDSSRRRAMPGVAAAIAAKVSLSAVVSDLGAEGKMSLLRISTRRCGTMGARCCC